MTRQLIFALTLLVTVGVFAYTVRRIILFFSFTRRGYPIRSFGKRLGIMLRVAFGQTKIFRQPFTGILHALVFWGFCVILAGSLEMIIDGLAGTERLFKPLGIFYQIIMASGDVFALIVSLAILVFLFRRIFLHIKRFHGIEMKPVSHLDANVALTLILLLMLSLLSMNMAYVSHQSLIYGEIAGAYPVSSLFSGLFSGLSAGTNWLIYELSWWVHIILIFLFANLLPYSKHFHVFMSVPNVFLTRLEPLGKLRTMDDITHEVRFMMDPATAYEAPPAETPVARFGAKDVDDLDWKSYFDALSCTECGRCTTVCPANQTGKKLSPRKIVMDLRARMKEKGPGLIREGGTFSDRKSLLRDYISVEELWACTLCNACAAECPININHPSIIVEMRRYLVMEEAYAPGEIKSVFSNLENNGAPWQYAPDDRLRWADKLEINLP